jgi:hypothetical protein
MADGLTLYPVERLGNQLFTYAAVFAQAHRLGVPCYVNKAFFEHVRPERAFTHRYELDVFDSGLVVPEAAAYHLPVYLGFPAIPLARRWHNQFSPAVPGTGGRIFMERSFAYDPRLRDVRQGTTVLGFFQSWRYFSDRGDEIRARLSRLTKPSDWYLRMSEELRPGTGSIGLNVRRGDYLLPHVQRVHGLATRAFYERALDHLRRMGLDGPVYLASDSLDKVRREFSGMSEFRLIDPPPGVHPLEVIQLLSRVDGLVIANSSFSWWAAFAGERPGQVVIAPRPWFTQACFDTSDLLPSHWLTLDRNGYDAEAGVLGANSSEVLT